MKQLVLLLLFFMSFNLTGAQEWFTSFEVAKRIALIQDKMLLVLWEDVLNDPYPVTIKNDNKTYLIDLSLDEQVDPFLWEHFVLVLLPDSQYNDILTDIKKNNKRSLTYINKLNSDKIKIMDVNKNILNIKSVNQQYQNLSELVRKYSISTAFLKQELINYSKQRDFNTALKLGAKYIDFTILAESAVKIEINTLATIYLKEAEMYLNKNDKTNKEAYKQRIELLKIKQVLMVNKPKKAYRLLKKYPETDIVDINIALFNLLNYTTFNLLEDQDKVSFWKEKLTETEIKTANLILKNL